MVKPRKNIPDGVLEAFGEALQEEYKKVFTAMMTASGPLSARELSWFDKKMALLNKNAHILGEHMVNKLEENDNEHAEENNIPDDPKS